jgi:hypothetical protein
MPSNASAAFHVSLRLGRTLRDAATDKRLRPISERKRNDLLHASLAAYVANWDSYVNSVVREFVSVISNTLSPEYAAAHGIMSGFVEKSLKKFNTPNWDNSRSLLIECTGFDPFADWIWPRAKMRSLDVQNYLNEILKVRHSFAHGLSIPSYSWTTTAGGRNQLNSTSLLRIEKFLTHMVKVTDRGLSAHGRATYPSRPVWRE